MTLTMELPSWKPRSYQKLGVKLMISQACLGLLYKPGLGKTSVVYMGFRILQDGKFVNKMLVISPIRPMYNVWPEQIHKYAEFNHLRVGVMHGKDKEKVLQSDDYDIYVVNPEGLAWLFGATVSKKKAMLDPDRVKYIKAKFQMLCVDESTEFRNSDTNRFKMLKALIPHFKRRVIMTGTPMPKSLMDWFGQIYVLDEGYSLGRYITHYRTEYFYPAGFGGYDWKPQAGAMERIMDKIHPLVQVVEVKDNIDLPEVVYDDVWVTLPPEARAHYKKMENDLVALMESGNVVAANAAVASSKCRQIANGCIYHSEEVGEYTPLHEEKLIALGRLMEELDGDPLLVTYEFGFDRQEIKDKFNMVCISTGSAKKDNENIKLFQIGALSAVMGHPKSISLGIDGLQDNCCHIAMFGVTWNLLHYEQVIDRIKRSGNKSKTVVVHRILARDTVDERVLSVLDARDKAQSGFMAMLSGLRK